MNGGSDGVEARIERILALPLGAVVLALLEAVGAGVTVGAVSLRGRYDTLTNVQTGEERYRLVLVVAATVLVAALFHGFRAVRTYRESPDDDEAGRLRAALGTFHGPNRAGLPLLATPFLFAAFGPDRPETYHPQTTLLFLVATGVTVGLAHPSWFGRAALRDVPRSAAIALTVLAASAWGAWHVHLAILRHEGMLTRIFDLAIYESILSNASQGMGLATNFVKGGNHAGAHFDPILIGLSPLYGLFPTTKTLFVIQEVFVASGALPLFWLAERRIGDRVVAFFLASLYLLQPALQGATLYDFHSLTLSAPFIPWIVWLLEVRSRVALSIVCALLVTVREDMALLLTATMAFAAFGGYGAKKALVVSVSALAWLWVVKHRFMPHPDLFMHGSDAYSYSGRFAGLIPEGKGAPALFASILTNPSFVVSRILSEDRLLFLAKVFGPLLAFPLLFGGRSRLLFLYGTAFTLLSSRAIQYSPDLQYPVVLVPAVCVSNVFAVEAFGRSRLRGIVGNEGARAIRPVVVAMTVASVLVAMRFGSLGHNVALAPGNKPLLKYVTEGDRARVAHLREVLRSIPTEASLALSDSVGPHASTRPGAMRFESGNVSEWIVAELRTMEPPDLARFRQVRSSGEYVDVSEAHGIVVLRRIASAPDPAR
ncbi:MAG: DUF2079 domain-containing protein [Polyangiaceae bacterium]